MGQSTTGESTASDATLILLRHGESQWNALNLFTGWVDVDLTDKGRAEPSVGRTDRRPGSPARRGVHLAFAPRDHHGAPGSGCRRSAVDPGPARLAPERAALRRATGLDKAETKAKYGDDQFMKWRRSYDTLPHPSSRAASTARTPTPLCRNRRRAVDGMPGRRVARFVPHYEDTIVPELRAGKTVLVVAHGNRCGHS